MFSLFFLISLNCLYYTRYIGYCQHLLKSFKKVFSCDISCDISQKYIRKTRKIFLFKDKK
nr:MAG TPA: hypothetical protein [Caudoviricetes sp.]